MNDYSKHGSNTGPLAGLRVVEMGQLLAGPFAGQLLADMGAQVIKVEDPERGDPMRTWGRTLPKGQSLWWAVLGRNKESVTVDLRRESGQEVARRLISTADVVIENFRPGTLERWGLSYETLAAKTPGLILARVTGFGQTGPYSHRAGYGSIGEAMGGLRYIVGDPSRPPSRMGISIGDTLAAVFATIGILAALHERTSSGLGQVIDAAIYESVLAVMESVVPEFAVSGHIRERTGAVLPNIAPSNIYPTADGQDILIAANQDSVFGRLCVAMGTPELARDERFIDHVSRGQNQKSLDLLITDWSRKISAKRIEQICESHGVPVGAVYRAPEMLGDAHYAARESIIDILHPELGKLPMQNVFPRMSRTQGTVRWPGQALGESTDRILEELGYSVEERTALRAVVSASSTTSPSAART